MGRRIGQAGSPQRTNVPGHAWLTGLVVLVCVLCAACGGDSGSPGSPSSNAWSAPQTIARLAEEPAQLVVKGDATGTAVVVWETHVAAGLELWGARLTPGSAGAVERLSAEVRAGVPALALNSQGQGLLAYVLPGAEARLAVRSVDTLRGFGPERIVAQGASVAAPGVAVDAMGRVLLLWYSERVLWAVHGTPEALGAPQRAADSAGGQPQALLLPDGRGLAVWADYFPTGGHGDSDLLTAWEQDGGWIPQRISAGWGFNGLELVPDARGGAVTSFERIISVGLGVDVMSFTDGRWAGSTKLDPTLGTVGPARLAGLPLGVLALWPAKNALASAQQVSEPAWQPLSPPTLGHDSGASGTVSLEALSANTAGDAVAAWVAWSDVISGASSAWSSRRLPNASWEPPLRIDPPPASTQGCTEVTGGPGPRDVRVHVGSTDTVAVWSEHVDCGAGGFRLDSSRLLLAR
jgi:hypothetical protein